MAEKQAFPKIPESNWWALRKQFQSSVSLPVTPTYLQSILGISEKTAKNVIPQLKLLGLIDNDDDKPTPRAIDWRSDSTYKNACEEMVKYIYPDELIHLFPGPEFDVKKITDWFMRVTKSGEGAARQAAVFYILIKSGNLKNIEETIKKQKTDSTKKQKTERKKALNIQEEGKIPVDEKNITTINEPKAYNIKDHKFNPDVHINIQIHISPDSTPEQIEAIFASMSKHFKP